MSKNDYYMIKGEDYKQMAIKVLKAAKVAEDIADRSRRIGIKPNILAAKKASEGAVTHPELVDGVLSYLKEEGFSNLVVLEGSWVGDLTSQAVRVCGIYDVCKKHQVPFIDLQKDAFRTVDAKGMPISVCEEVFQLDYLINLPVLKGHCQTTVTCALKNSKGLIPNSEKRRFHTLGLHKPIAHLNTVIRQDFILLDNICGDLDFEEGGNPVVMNRVLGFWDPVLCDSFAAESMGYEPKDIAYIRLAEQLGVGSTDVAHANPVVLEESAPEKSLLKKSLQTKKPHYTKRVSKLAAYADAKDACSACYGSLIYALDRLDEEGLLRAHRTGSVSIGQGYRGKSGKLGVGQCTGCFEKSLGGCPPKAVDIAQFLREQWE